MNPFSAVHPRTCGERYGITPPRASRRGSSPHLRGTPAQQPPAQESRRFIPAPAGNADAAIAISGIITVHPRTCGERMI
ncbi:hypothetical protein SAMN05421693_10161 [Ectothiorhodospira magna]|uniref:Uncharacterized protein n=1 Tax=Ectothiorhodospira magna TaxID=867345 RepID=A0A1H8YY20_9GAMM|nr:hypothetical protein SAMN05421693_10161 [Ectothiorhodospira magna]